MDIKPNSVCVCGHTAIEHATVFSGEIVDKVVTQDIKSTLMECIVCDCEKFQSTPSPEIPK